MKLIDLSLAFVLSFVLALASCIKDDADGPHCSVLEGDATCAALGGQLPYCDAGCELSPYGNGCVAERPEDDACYSPCGGSLTAEELAVCPTSTESGGDASTSTTTSGTATTSTTSIADDTSTDTSSVCMIDDDCVRPTPLCLEGICSSCDLSDDPNAACAAHSLNEGLNEGLCVEGVCVECSLDDARACTGITPVCNPNLGSCVGCTRHEQCPTSACHIEQGGCMPTALVWWVDGDAGRCPAANGSEGAPYCTLANAMANVGAGELGTLIVRARDGGLAYPEDLTITAGRVVALRGAPDERPRITGSGIGSPVTVSGGAVAYLDGGFIDGSVGAEAIQVVGAVLHLHSWVLVLNPGGAISLSNGAELFADNVVAGANGSALVDAQALRATDSSFSLRYVTIAANDSAGVASIQCTGGTSGSVRNAIIVGLDPGSVDCAGLMVNQSAVDSMFEGEGLVMLDAFDPAWFLGPGAGDFHVAPGHPFADVASWELGDPPVDLDGDLRPERPGTPDVAGADR